jgi:hypothetical protein
MSHNGTRWKSAQERIPVHIDKKEATDYSAASFYVIDIIT